MATLSIEPYDDTHAVILRDRGGIFVLFAAASSLLAKDQLKACENVRAGIRRAAAIAERSGAKPQRPEPTDVYEADRDPSDDSVIGGAPDDQGGSLHLAPVTIAGTDDPNPPMVSVAEIGVNLGASYAAAYLGPRDAREVARWLVQWADWRDDRGGA